jgi:hypothetical protein
MYLRIEFDIPNSSGLLVIAVKLTVKLTFLSQRFVILHSKGKVVPLLI